jgi:magnesium chelatase family protein
MTTPILTRGAQSPVRNLLRHAHTLNSATLDGIDGKPVEVQARAVEIIKSGESPWSRAVSIAGLPRSEATQLITRISGALACLGFVNSPVKIVLNIHPAISNTGSGGGGTGSSATTPAALDLPIALSLLQAAGYLPPDETGWSGSYLFFGMLDAHGDARHTPGALPLALASRPGQAIVCPSVNAKQCLLTKATRPCRILPVAGLEAAMRLFQGQRIEELPGGKVVMEPIQGNPPDFAHIAGQERAKRAAVIAAAGGHALLLVGSPGSGKTMISNAISGILPPLENAEKVELTRIWSAAGMIDSDGQAVTRRPFRVVHHTATKQAVVGGGSKSIQPGEVTLAHLGVLFLDEIAEFRADVLDSLRQPMEDGCVRISRTHRKTELPSRFSLVAAMNPCSCGYYPNCECGEAAAAKYQSKLSGPLLDRIDMKVAVSPVPIGTEPSGESTAELRKIVTAAMQRQRDRHAAAGVSYHSNADVPGQHARQLFKLTEGAGGATAERDRIAKARGMSMRGVDRMQKVARTIADLEGSETVEARHVAEAAEFC